MDLKSISLTLGQKASLEASLESTVKHSLDSSVLEVIFGHGISQGARQTIMEISAPQKKKRPKHSFF